MNTGSSYELLQLIEQSSLSSAEKSVLVIFLNQLKGFSIGCETAWITFNNIFTFISELQHQTIIPLGFISFYLANFPEQTPIFPLFQHYYQAWRCLPESLKSKPSGDRSGLIERTTSQLKASYGNLLSLFSPCNSQPALIDASSGVILSHQALFKFVENFSLPIHITSLKPVIVLALPNGPLLGLALLSTVSFYTALPVNINGGQEQFRSDVLLTNSRHILAIEGDVQRLGLREKWVTDSGMEVFLLEQGPDLTFKVKGLDSIPIGQPSPRRPNGPDDMALVLFTSGTTGTKKMVPVTLHTIISGISCVVQSWGLTSQDVCLNMMPLNHVYVSLSSPCLVLF